VIGDKETELPLFATVDVWDALRSNRPFRPAWPEEKAMDYIRDQSAKHFDPKISDFHSPNETNMFIKKQARYSRQASRSLMKIKVPGMADTTS
jgi:HD-GYP domain-containing protein (c-di-GMP phosphodiesterase class II)